jgi:hypothetical protein
MLHIGQEKEKKYYFLVTICWCQIHSISTPEILLKSFIKTVFKIKGFYFRSVWFFGGITIEFWFIQVGLINVYFSLSFASLYLKNGSRTVP